MRLIIAGSRQFDPSAAKRLVSRHMDAWVRKHGMPTHVLSGGAAGIDVAGEQWLWDVQSLSPSAETILVKYPADWAKYGKRAGPLRNAEMAQNADALLLIWDGKSPGSASMLKEAQRAGLHITQVVVGEG